MPLKYKLGLKYPPDVLAESNGNFNVTKEYRVTASPRASIDGIVIQYVNKSTSVVDADGTKYDTTEAIRQYTDGMVQFSNDAYFEIFLLYPTGNSKHADAFQNNSIVKYELEDGELVPNTYDTTDELYKQFKTEGHISVTGENCFISYSNPNYKAISNLPWSDDDNTPANGLLFLPYSDAAHKTIFNATNSNIMTHRVDVEWTFKDPESRVQSKIFNGGI
jgi:hypothetical protein